MLYRINVDNDGDGRPDVIYDFRFKTTVVNPNTFLYNTGPIASLDSPNFNRRQTYSVTEFHKNRVPSQARRQPDVATVQRRGSVDAELLEPCELGHPRPRGRHQGLRRSAARRILRRPRRGVRPCRAAAVPEPSPDLDPGRRRRERAPLVQRPHDRDPDPDHSPHPRRQRSERSHGERRDDRRVGVGVSPEGTGAQRRQWSSPLAPGCRSSRLGNPLFNEVIVPMGRKDDWNATTPDRDKDYAQYVAQPELAKLLPVLYPGVFPNLACLQRGPRRSAGDPADRHPRRHRPGLPELHRNDPSRHAAAERRDQAVGHAERRTASSAETSPASRTAGGCSTTS